MVKAPFEKRAKSLYFRKVKPGENPENTYKDEQIFQYDPR